VTTYIIDISKKQTPIKEKVNNKLLWYDSDNNKMLEFEGGKIVPFFDIRKNKLVPKVEDIYTVKYELMSNTKEIEEWLKNYGSRYGAQINLEESSNRGVAVNVDKHNTDYFEYALDRKGFKYNKQ